MEASSAVLLTTLTTDRCPRCFQCILGFSNSVTDSHWELLRCSFLGHSLPSAAFCHLPGKPECQESNWGMVVWGHSCHGRPWGPLAHSPGGRRLCCQEYQHARIPPWVKSLKSSMMMWYCDSDSDTITGPAKCWHQLEKVVTPGRCRPSGAQGLARGLVWISVPTCVLVQVLSCTAVCAGLNQCASARLMWLMQMVAVDRNLVLDTVAFFFLCSFFSLLLAPLSTWYLLNGPPKLADNLGLSP